MPSNTRRIVYNPKHHRTSRPSCFRNPCVVFICSFLVLATLRFRVRPKRAAQWIHKHSRPHLIRSKKEKEPEKKGASVGNMEFRLQEEGKLPSGSPFQRYQAVLKTDGESKAAAAASIQEWTSAMMSLDESSLQSFLGVLRNNPYQAFFFETRPVTGTTEMATKSFEFVLVDAPDLYQFATSRPDPMAFSEHFKHCKTAAACVFSSLHKDATLVAPKSPGDNANLAIFSHLADFCRGANADLVSSTWKLAIQTYLQQVERQSSRPLWFSTSGMGIAWLHFRVDTRPKYYTYAKFRNET